MAIGLRFRSGVCASVAAGAAGGALALTAGAARAQVLTPPAAMPLGAVRGAVIDSLRGRPLAGAAVFVDGTARSTLTDSAGRFSLDSVPAGRQVVSVTHPELDAAGLDGAAVRVAVAPGGAADVIVATPSRRTLWSRLCAGDPPSDSVGALFGEVRDARTGALVAGARVGVAWTAVDRVRRRLVVGRGGATAVTDSVGTFRLCGVPLGAELAVDAAAGALDSARAQVTLDGQPFARVDLWVRGAAPVAAAVLPSPPGASRAPEAGAEPATAARTAAPARGTAVLTGVVRDTLGAPRQGARVTVDGVDGAEAVSGPDGRFRLTALPAGTRPVVVRAVGFAPQVTNATLRPGREAEIAVALGRVVRLAGITARARRGPNAYLLDQLARRRATDPNAFVDSTVIWRSIQLRTAFTRVPFTRVQGSPAQWGMTDTKGCPLVVALDDRRTTWDEINELPPEYVLMIEVYRRQSLIPSRFWTHMSRGGGCGLALVWTRNGR